VGVDILLLSIPRKTFATISTMWTIRLVVLFFFVGAVDLIGLSCNILHEFLELGNYFIICTV